MILLCMVALVYHLKIGVLKVTELELPYSYVSNKLTCAFILFRLHMSSCTALFEPAGLLILEEIALPARLLKPAPF